MIGVGAGSLLSIVIGSNDTATQKKFIANANYLLIVVFQFGVEGAAWGTNLGKKKATFETNELKIIRDKNITKQILSLGFPSLIMTTMSVVQGVIVMYALNSYGTASDVAFYGVVYRYFPFPPNTDIWIDESLTAGNGDQLWSKAI
jgi:hypothetical protein